MNLKNFKRMLMNLSASSLVDEPGVICYIPQWETFRNTMLYK
jgi:hypothetical protein